jgi:hypothetical protein
VEHFESEVLLGAKELIASRMIRNIFTEVSGKNPNEHEALEVIVGAGYKLHKFGFMMGPNIDPYWLQPDNVTASILGTLKEKKTDSFNLRWVL